MAGCWKNLKDTTALSLFLACQNRNRSAPLRELLSNDSLFVGQLLADKSPPFRARDLIFFTDLQTVNLLNNSLLELIYFLNKTSEKRKCIR